MKKIFSLLGLLVLLFSSGAWAAADVVLVDLPFSDASSPSLTPDGSNSNRGTANYEYDSPINGAKFLNVWGENNSNGFKVATITDQDVTTYGQWTLEFDWAGYSGCNKKAGQTKLVDSNGNTFFSIDDAANWGNTFSLSIGGSVACYPCNKSTRISAATGSVLAINYWHHITVIGYSGGVLVNIEQYGAGGSKTSLVQYAKVSDMNCTPASIGLRPGSCGSVAIQNLKLTVGDLKLDIKDYAVKYVDQDGNTVKVVNGAGLSGSAIKLTDSDKVDFYSEDGSKKYGYVSDDAQGKTVGADGKTVVTVTVREMPKFTYTVVNSFGSKLASGSSFENDNVTAAYPQFSLDGTTLYENQRYNDSKKQYNITFNLDQDNKEVVITASKKADNVIYYSEGENIEGMSACSGNNVGVRCSNSAAGTSASPVTITNIPMGVYTIAVGEYDNSSNDHHTAKFTVGDQTLEFATGAVNQNNKSFENIAVADDVDVIFNGVGSANNGLDYIYIQKTKEIWEADGYVAADGITISEAEATIGATTTMKATVSPATATLKSVKWSVEDESVATIDEKSGDLTPLKAGKVKVIAKNGAPGEPSGEYELTIAPAEFAVTITGAPSEAQVFVGEDASAKDVLSVTTKAGYDQMQNTSLLQPQGSVTATKIPTYIYEIAVDKTKKTINVLYEEDIEVTAMSFEPSEQRIAQGNSRTLKVTYTPSDASFKTATWTSSNPEVATVDANTGYVTAIAEGETTITATWTENESHGTDYSAQLKLTVDKGLVLDRLVFDELEDGTAEVMGYYHPMDGDTLYLASHIESNGRMVPVSFIRYEAFIGSNLKSIVIPGTVKTIDHRALQYSNTHNAYEELPEDGLESAFLMEGVEVMRDRIFHGNKYMKKVFLPSTLTDIGYYSFYGTAIEDVFFGGSEDEWNALKNLENAKLPETAKIHFNSDFTSAFIDGIEVDEESVELEVGEQKAIGFIITPESIAPSVEVTFTSSDESVATVDETGVITAVADGFATITVSAGAGIEAKVRVKVGNGARDYTTPLTTTWSVQGGANPEGIFVDEEEHYYNNWGAGTSWFAQAYAEFDLSNLQPDDDFKATFTVWVNCARGTRTFDVYGLPAGTTVADCQELTAKKGVELATYSDIVTDYQAKEVDVTDYIKGLVAEGSQNAIIIMSNGAAGGKIYGKGSAEFAPTLNIAPANGEGGIQTTGISEAQSNESTVKSGKYMENGQIVIYIDGKKFNAAGQQMK